PPHVRDATGVDWSSAWAFAHVGWEGTPDQADEGVAVFAREPLGAVRELAYATPGDLRRVGLVAELAPGLSLTTVHLDYVDPAAREDQARQTAAFVPVWGLDAVVAGDLNDRAGSPTHAAFGAMGFVDGTAALDPERIDHLFVHGAAAWEVQEARLVLTDPAVSDHPGIVAVLAPRPPPAVGTTRFVAEVDVGFGAWVAVRGDAGPLSWDRGWWAAPTAPDRWELVVPSPSGPFAYKALRDEVDWEQGDDHLGEPGVEQRWTPVF
ncbi:MAG: endonuclease/exonuclease/phosphatase family protein, partial [Myxococcota bacterium]